MENKGKVREHGITLVALVITIIILLILAGVAITALTQTGLFENAKQVKNATENAQKKENETLSEYIDQINEYLPETLAYKVNSGEIPIGSYIKYTPDAASEETINKLIEELGTYSGSESNTKETLKQEIDLNWRVLDVKDGQVRLISDVPTTSSITLGGYNGYNNAVKLIDDTCSMLYNNSKLANKVQNLKIEDVQDKMIEKDYTKISSNYGKIFTPSNKYYPNILLNEKEQEITISGEQTINEQLKYSEQNNLIKQEESKIADILKVKYTYWGEPMSTDKFENSKYYELFINNGNNYSKYWISSRCVYTDSSNAYFHVRCIINSYVYSEYLYHSGDIERATDYAYRPVVILKSNIKIDTTNTGEGTESSPYNIKL